MANPGAARRAAPDRARPRKRAARRPRWHRGTPSPRSPDGFEAQGIAAELCLVKPDATAEPEIVARLTTRDYACVVIGGGIRKPDETVELLERAIHLVRQHAPRAAIAFNTNPTNSVDAALRWLR